jgi:hypothetical protein
MAEDPQELKDIIEKLYSSVTLHNPDSQPYTPATANCFGEDEENIDIDLYREQHALFIFGMFDSFPRYMLS